MESIISRAYAPSLSTNLIVRMVAKLKFRGQMHLNADASALTTRYSMQREYITYAPTAERRASKRARILIFASQGGIKRKELKRRHRSERVKNRCQDAERAKERKRDMCVCVRCNLRFGTAGHLPRSPYKGPFVYFQPHRLPLFAFGTKYTDYEKKKKGQKIRKNMVKNRANNISYGERHSESIIKYFKYLRIFNIWGKSASTHCSWNSIIFYLIFTFNFPIDIFSLGICVCLEKERSTNMNVL